MAGRRELVGLGLEPVDQAVRRRTAAEMLASSRTSRCIAAARGGDVMVPERRQEVLKESVSLDVK
jgi:hypothetical protein